MYIYMYYLESYFFLIDLEYKLLKGFLDYIYFNKMYLLDILILGIMINLVK